MQVLVGDDCDVNDNGFLCIWCHETNGRVCVPAQVRHIDYMAEAIKRVEDYQFPLSWDRTAPCLI